MTLSGRSEAVRQMPIDLSPVMMGVGWTTHRTQQDQMESLGAASAPNCLTNFKVVWLYTSSIACIMFSDRCTWSAGQGHPAIISARITKSAPETGTFSAQTH